MVFHVAHQMYRDFQNVPLDLCGLYIFRYPVVPRHVLDVK